MPKETVLKFKESVAALEMDTALTVIDEIRGQNEPLANALQKLAGTIIGEATGIVLGNQ